jgi:sodium/potassium-transporting ATPase subunit alpha
VVGNKLNFAGIVAGAMLGMFIIYTPPLHVVFGGSFRLSPLYWLIPAAFGVLLLVWASIRVLLLRKSMENARVKDIKGLMMCTSPVAFFLLVSSNLMLLQSLQ